MTQLRYEVWEGCNETNEDSCIAAFCRKDEAENYVLQERADLERLDIDDIYCVYLVERETDAEEERTNG